MHDIRADGAHSIERAATEVDGGYGRRARFTN